MKRVIDVIVAVSALVLLALPLAALAVWIKLSSPGPVIYRQIRVGRAGQIFYLFKFRSMVPDADLIGGYKTQSNDPRITRVGRILRRTSLDEIPQLINVLIGNMSLVGPRPDVPAQKKNYSEEEWLLRHRVRPGITGLAQVNGRSNISTEVRKQLDLEYASNANLCRDISILFKTVLILSGRDSN